MYLIITRTFPPEIGGMQMLMWGLSNELSKHENVKVFAESHYEASNHDKKINFNITRIGGFKLIRKYRKANLINDFIKKNKVNAVIADHWKSLELIKFEKNFKKKKLCLIHSKEINHNLGSYLNKRVIKTLNSVDYVIANSKFTKNLAIEKGVNKEKIIIINPGVPNLEKINKEDSLSADKILLNKFPKLITVSRFDKRKNHEKVIMALRNLKEIYPNIFYICIGYGDEEEKIKKLAKHLDLSKHIIFLKDISSSLKNALVSKSNLFVMPSIKFKKSVEGFGISYIEAAQHGIPSLGGIDGGASDAIIQNQTGILCDGNNLEDIYNGINDLIKNNRYIELGNNAKNYSKKFSWEIIIQKYLKLISD